VPEGLCGDTPNETFQLFRDHLNDLLHKTITDASLLQTKTGDRASLEFRQGKSSVAVKLGKRYYLYLGQTLQAKKIEQGTYRLKTLAYAYRIAEGPQREDKWIVRWEYNSRDHQEGFHPRNHCHLPLDLVCFGNRMLSLNKMHIPTGWVTIEEVIRFLIHELKVKAKSAGWDKYLRESEDKFRLWTARSEG